MITLCCAQGWVEERARQADPFWDDALSCPVAWPPGAPAMPHDTAQCGVAPAVHTLAKCCRDQMDLIAFTDFVLAWDHRSHPAAIKYFFDIFDLKKQVGWHDHFAHHLACSLHFAC